jgi:UDP-N-acetylmuramate--alanine ligase
MGVGGAAAAGAAILARAAGAEVTACDSGGPGQLTPAVEAAGIAIAWSNDPSHVAGPSGPVVDRLAVTKAVTSVEPDHPELGAAATAGIPTESLQQVIADAAATGDRRLIGVTGTHGKSTTAGALLHLLVEAGLDPSAFVGAPLPAGLTGGLPGVARIGQGSDVVVEADEYAGNFDPYRPAIGVLVSAEWDHPDVFPDEDAVVDTYVRWIGRFVGTDGSPARLVANVGDRGVRRVVDRLAGWDGHVVPVRLIAPGDGRPGGGPRDQVGIVGRIASEDGDGTTLEIIGLRMDGTPDTVRTPLIGRHMAIDALAAAAGAHAAGAEPGAIMRGLSTFHGVGRRLELKGDVGGVVVLDDYAHHPTAIRETFAAARRRYPGRRLWGVYEPLTFQRTAAMLDAFADVLATADRAAIVDIWAVRDPDTTIVSAEDLARATSARAAVPAIATGSPEASAERLAELVEPGDVVLVMGGGRSYVAAEELVERLRDREATASG